MNAAAQYTGKAASTATKSLFTVISWLVSRSSHGAGPDLLPLLAQAVDSQPHRVAGAQKNRGSLPEAHAGRSAGGNDIARMQAHHSGQVADQLRDAKDHVGAVAVLIALAIHFEPHAKRMRIGNFVASDQPGTERTE